MQEPVGGDVKVGAAVRRFEKRDAPGEHTARTEHARDLAHREERIRHVFEDGVGDDVIHGGRRQG